MSVQFDFSKKFTKNKIEEFSNILQEMSGRIGFRVSARGWCYLMEQAGYINKDQFDKVESMVNKCRKEGFLPVDFVAEEDARAFANVQTPDDRTMEELLATRLEFVLDGHHFFTPDWWDGEKYYIQMLVEKIDLKTLFETICADYKIPIANAKGWSSILQRAEYARRFKEAEERGLKCVLLYMGDHDPDGLRISDTLRKNLEQVQDIRWGDDEVGYNPSNLIIKRFGLEYDFIIENGYTWIDNLITGSGGELAVVKDGKIVPGKTKNGKPHKNFNLPYLQAYLKKIGVRKCEANAVVTTPDIAKDLCVKEIESWLGEDSLERFRAKRKEVKDGYFKVLNKSGLIEPINKILGK